MADASLQDVSPKSQIAKGNTEYYAQNLATSERNLNYKAFVIATDQKILVEAWLPETVGTDVSASYEAPYAQGLSGKLPGEIGTLARFLGASLTTQAMTIQVWQGGAFIEFSIPFIFQAETSAAVDVMRPIKDLLKLTMPVDSTAGGGGFLTAPGPVIDPGALIDNGTQALGEVFNGTGQTVTVLTDSARQLVGGHVNEAIRGVVSSGNRIAQPLNNAIFKSIKNNISLYIGQFIYFPSVVITDVSPTYDVQIGPDRNPVRATVNVTFKTFYMPTSADIELMFPNATVALTGDAFQSSQNGGRSDASGYGDG